MHRKLPKSNKDRMFLWEFSFTVIEVKKQKHRLAIISIITWRNNFRLPLVKGNYGKQRRFYQWAKEWNILDAYFKEINSLLLFKQNILDILKVLKFQSIWHFNIFNP